MNFSNEDIPFQVIELIETLHTNQFEGWLVGGAIRTLMLGQKPHDWDVTTNATPDQMQSIFKHTIETGIAYGTVTVVVDGMHIQVTTFRKEGAYENHRKPTEVTYCKNIEDDLSRRDFTINAMAYNTYTKELRDPFDGQRDLDAQIIKAVGDPLVRFEEDALRILRAVRFQAQLGFFIDAATLEAMGKASVHLEKLSKERVQQELNKWLLGPHFSMTQTTAVKIGLNHVFEMEPDSHFMKHWDLISTIEPTLLFRLFAFVDLYTGSAGGSVKIDNSLKLLKTLKYSQQTISKVVQFIEFLLRPFDPEVQTDRHLMIKKGLTLGFEQAAILLQWKLQQSQDKLLFLKQKSHLDKLISSGYENRVNPLAIEGNRVMELLKLQPGPQIKTILDELQNWVFDHPDQNTQASLEAKLLKK